MMEERIKKWTVVALLWIAMLVSYLIRVALGVAAPTLMKLYGISPAVMGYVLSSWNWAYTPGTLIAGPLVDRFGPWLSMGVASAAWGVATMALPVARTPLALFLMRALFGAGQSPLIPVNAASISEWFGPERRATVVGLIFSGNQVGLAVGATVGAFLLMRFGWEAIFYVFGGASILFSLLWFLFYPGRALDRPAEGNKGEATGSNERVRWTALLRYRTTWGIFFGQMGYLYAYYFFLTWLPGYFILERKMSLRQMAIYASLPFWTGMVGTLGGGVLGDHLIRRGLSRTASRKVLIGVGLGMGTVTVVAAAFTAQAWLAVTLRTLCMGFLRLASASCNSTPIDIAPPTAVASMAAIHNFGANMGGLLAPIVTGYIVESSGSFVGALVAAGGMALFGAASYLFIAGRLETLPITPAGS